MSISQELQQQRALLQLEYNTEKEAYQRQADEAGLERRVQRGEAWWPVRAVRSYYNSLNQLCIEVHRSSPPDEDDDPDDHHFEYGKAVALTLPPDEPGKKGLKGQKETKGQEGQNGQKGQKGKTFCTGTVSFVDGNRMVVAVPDGVSLVDLQDADKLAVQLSFDETSYRTMFDALDRVMRAKGRLGELRDLFFSRRKAETFTFADMGFAYLNKTQEHAVNEVLRAKDVAIVHGPPGTGKTTTLVEAIYETLRREPQVLVCAQSNMAVDWISEKLVDRGVNVLRIGNPTRVNDKMLSFTYERRFEAHPDYPQLWALRKAIRDVRAHRKRGDEKYHQKLESLKARATELEIRINQELFGEARVVASTLVGSGHRLLEGMKFGTLFIDEAAQALEAACWIAIRRAGRVVLAGDHCQLPPTVKSIAALKAGLGITLMERLVELHPEAVTLLRIQYRMNEEIMRFSSDWFYNNQVESAPEVRYRGILDWDVPMEWIQQDDALLPGADEPLLPDAEEPLPAGETEGSSGSRLNRAEAELTLQTLQNYFEKIGKTRILEERIDVGIISPYRAQVQCLRSLLRKRAYFKPFRSLISVNTVDGFQGQERDVIVISLVRQNDEGQIGFLRDLRRMNVAITRARMKLLIIGDSHTLTRHHFYRKLWQYVKALNSE